MSKNPFGNMGNIMKQAQAMQEQLAKIQEQAGAKTVQGTAGGGMVTVTANGAMEVTAVKIDPEVMKSGDVDMLQDLIVAATGEALRNAKDMMANEMKSVTGACAYLGCSRRLLRYPFSEQANCMSIDNQGLLTRLIRELVRLPGIGQKTAQRLAFHILKLKKSRHSALRMPSER